MAESVCRLVWAQHTYHQAQRNHQLYPEALVQHQTALAAVQDLEHQPQDHTLLRQVGAQLKCQQLPQDSAASLRQRYHHFQKDNI